MKHEDFIRLVEQAGKRGSQSTTERTRWTDQEHVLTCDANYMSADWLTDSRRLRERCGE